MRQEVGRDADPWAALLGATGLGVVLPLFAADRHVELLGVGAAYGAAWLLLHGRRVHGGRVDDGEA